MPKQDRFFRPLVEFFRYKNEKKNDKKDIPCLGLLYKITDRLLGIIRSAAVEHETLLSLETN